jgi:hypothetical protein
MFHPRGVPALVRLQDAGQESASEPLSLGPPQAVSAAVRGAAEPGEWDEWLVTRPPASTVGWAAE